MIIGTTPTFTLRVRKTDLVDFTAASNIYVTLKQGNLLLTKNSANITVVDSKTIQVSLTQAESLDFVIDKAIELQVNWTYLNGLIVKRAATKVVSINLEKQLLKQELT